MLRNVGLQQIIYSIGNDPLLRLPLFSGKITTLQLGGKDLLCRYLRLMKGHLAIRPDRVLAQSRASATGAIKNDEHLAALGCDLHAEAGTAEDVQEARCLSANQAKMGGRGEGHVKPKRVE